jgi:hypothetical protein
LLQLLIQDLFLVAAVAAVAAPDGQAQTEVAVEVAEPH